MNYDGRIKSTESEAKNGFSNILVVYHDSRQLSKVVLGCVTDWQQETRGLFRVESFYGDRPGLWHQARSPAVDSTSN